MLYKKLNLISEAGNSFYYSENQLQEIYKELEEFLEKANNLNNLHFAKKMLFSYEIKANNQVEGYGDDFLLIEKIIKQKEQEIKDINARKRIINLYRGYQYILENHNFSQDSLKEIYDILSNGLLDEYDLTHFGKFYRLAPVYILRYGRLDNTLDEGIDYQKIPDLIDKYFQFLTSSYLEGDMVAAYIKSQILHFYFVYIHPYFDVNGRTSRTMSLWYLLDKEAYPFIIFNRGISFKGSKYDKVISDAKKSFNITSFLNLMLLTVKTELEKEYIIQNIASNIDNKLRGMDYQTLLYFLTMNGVKTVKDFTFFYNSFNDKKKALDIYKEMIMPLIEMDVFNVERYTKRFINNELPNMVLKINPSKIDLDKNIIKRVKIK